MNYDPLAMRALAMLAVSRGFDYTAPTPQSSHRGQSLPHAVAGFDSLNQPCDESRSSPAEPAALLSVPPVFGGSDGEPKGSPVPARAARSVNPFEPPPSFDSDGDGFCKPQHLEAIMAHSPALGITAHITVIDGQPTTTTQDIADVYGKRHDDVLRIVRQRMTEAGEWGVRNFTDTPHTNPQNGQTYTVIRMTKKGFHFVVGKFTGAKAVAHQIAFADEFERMERELLARTTRPHNPAIDYDRISPAQAQDLKEIVQAIVQAGVQGHGETWARLHRKFRVNSYLELPATRHLDARQYLIAKLPSGNGNGTDLAVEKADHAERVRYANQAANGVAAQVQAQVFSAVLGGSDQWRQQRWLVGSIDSSPVTVNSVSPDAYVATLKGLAHHIRHHGEGDRDSLMALAEAVNWRMFSAAANNPNQGFGAEVAKQIHAGMNWADLHAISVAANMEAWLRSGNNPKPIAA